MSCKTDITQLTELAEAQVITCAQCQDAPLAAHAHLPFGESLMSEWQCAQCGQTTLAVTHTDGQVYILHNQLTDKAG